MNIKKIIREEFDWIKDVSDQVPSVTNRSKISYEEFLGSVMKHDPNLVDSMLDAEMIVETDEEGDITIDGVNYHWEDPKPWNWEVREHLEYGLDTPEWVYVDRVTIDYELEYSSYTDAIIFKRKSDGRYFGYTTTEDYHGDGYNDEMSNGLYEMFNIMVPKWV
jgi:hypothetical protein